MKLSCKVVEDILPMYYDGVCSEETSALVEEHISQCSCCRNMLERLQAELQLSPLPVDDAKPLKEFQRKWKKSELSWIKKGICLTLAALLLVLSVSAGIWYFSYGKHYQKLIANMEPTPEAESFFSSSDYMHQSGQYRFEVWLPELLSNNGFARVMETDGLVLFLYPEMGGKYTFKLLITDDSDWSTVVYLNADMTPDFEGHQFPVRSDSEKLRIRELLDKKKTSIQALMEAVEQQWGISLEEQK